jgi:hypothetical protein
VKEIFCGVVDKHIYVVLFYVDGLQSKVIEALLDIKIPSIRQQVSVFRRLLLFSCEKLPDKE